ncbi:DNA-directed RNA polymerase III subunit RPC6-like [Oppia nitens]|uniref:DNA-directed RNA polymerase III subunit RPC6-like n=1 Tax=Oppia nitens TaxID=1686743 RepID=UPI0023DC9E8B|nr:DNA-directed RNA polymerase III subunit RPC6-like [Oppia nitens]
MANNEIVGAVAGDSMTLSTIMNNIIELCMDNEKGITEKTLQIAMTGVNPLVRADAVNQLLGQNKIEICKQGIQLLYRIKDKTSANKGSDEEEKIVFAIIEKASNKGIWIRDIRFQSNLSQTLLNKVLKNMETKKLIKSVKSVTASKKKVYMLYDVEPDRSVTGGSWYSGNDYESEFIEVLAQQCLRFLWEKTNKEKQNAKNPIARQNQSFVTSRDVLKFINDVGISKVELSVDDIESILDTLVYDGKVDKHVSTENTSTGSNKLYRYITSLAKDPGFMRMPCSVCPVYKDCHIDGIISPLKCVYLKEWFDM